MSSIIKYSELPIESKTSCPPDGIYKFSINVCQGTQEFCKVQAVLIRSNRAYEILVREDKWDEAYQVLKYIEYVRIFSNDNNLKKALESFLRTSSVRDRQISYNFTFIHWLYSAMMRQYFLLAID